MPTWRAVLIREILGSQKFSATYFSARLTTWPYFISAGDSCRAVRADFSSLSAVARKVFRSPEAEKISYSPLSRAAMSFSSAPGVCRAMICTAIFIRSISA